MTAENVTSCNLRNENDTLLYSIWDNKKNTFSYKSDKKAIPFHENCYRNCNDCSHKNSTGTQCRFVFPKKLVYYYILLQWFPKELMVKISVFQFCPKILITDLEPKPSGMTF